MGVEIKKKELEQEVLKRQQEILDLQLAMRLAQMETESSNTDQDETGSHRYKESVVSDGPDARQTDVEGIDKSTIPKQLPLCKSNEKAFLSEHVAELEVNPEMEPTGKSIRSNTEWNFTK
ncbi:hypothetical protein JTB14_013856 [Gonioctena quinquepunctata]|nr:hypothetical protein JTB14_013856 [Gonioctena quinquepunctata]